MVAIIKTVVAHTQPDPRMALRPVGITQEGRRCLSAAPPPLAHGEGADYYILNDVCKSSCRFKRDVWIVRTTR